MAIVIRLTVDGTPGDMYYLDARGALVPVGATRTEGTVPTAQADETDLWAAGSGSEALTEGGEILFDDGSGDALYEG